MFFTRFHLRIMLGYGTTTGSTPDSRKTALRENQNPKAGPKRKADKVMFVFGAIKADRGREASIIPLFGSVVALHSRTINPV